MLPAPEPDRPAEPEGFVVQVGAGERIHFLDWGGPDGAGTAASGILLVHGLAATAWTWTPVARRLRRRRRVVAMDLRGHGLSDAPTDGYEPDALAEDAIAAAEGSGVAGADRRVVLVGHGFGAIVAAWAAARLGERCAALVLVDGGWEDFIASTGMEPEEFLRSLDEPPEVYRSMAAYLADRRGFDPTSWDADQEQAARTAVVDVPAGRVVPVVRPHVVEGIVKAMFAYRPAVVLPSVSAPITALAAADDEAGTRAVAMAAAQARLASAGRRPIEVRDFPEVGHNLMRYRPADVAAAILSADRDV